jgi:LmbE family N-acetylglucosaminyl deacetylase
MRVPGRLIRVLARSKPVVPDRAWPILLALRSIPGDAALIGEPPFRSAAVVAAHPDDESLGCAGTLALLRRRGTPVSIAFATDGEATIGAATAPTETARRRRAEAVAACAVLGVDDVRFWGMPDGGLAERIPELASHLAQLVGHDHDGLLLPWFLDGHPDHEALSAALADAVVPRHLEVWGYETWTPLPANRLVDVSAVWDQKEAAIAAHVTAGQAFDLEAALGLNRWRSIHGLMGRGYAEGFLAAPVGEFLGMRARVRTLVRDVAHETEQGRRA